MLLTLRRLGGISLCALLAACPTTVGTPTGSFTATPNTDVKVGTVVQLDATKSTDPQNRRLTYSWTFDQLPNGSAATFNDAHSVTPSFVADAQGKFTIQLVVANAFIAAPPVLVDVNVGQCGAAVPVTGALAVNPPAPGVGVVTQVSAPQADDADNAAGCALGQTISYKWQLVSQPAGSTAALNNTTATAPSFVPDIGGDYTIRLTLTDSTNRSSIPAETTVTVASCGSNTPVISAINPSVESPGLGQSVQLSAVVSDADNAPSCGNLGQTFDYKWVILDLPQGSNAKLNSDTSDTPSFTTDIPGVYSFRVAVADSTGRISIPKDISITASQCGGNAPVAVVSSAPAAPQIGSAVQLSVAVSDVDNDTCHLGQTFTYAWFLRSQPSGSATVLNNSTATNPTFMADVAGAYLVELIVTDSAGVRSAAVQRTINVTSCGTAAPVIASLTQTSPAAGTLPNPGDMVTVASSVSDADDLCKPSGAPNQRQLYTWSFKARPANSQAFIEDPTLTTINFNTDTAGTYQLQLLVTDETGRTSAPKFIDVTTNRCGLAAPVISTATPPSASPASPNPGATVTLAATWSDTDNSTCSLGQKVALTWTKLQAPAKSSAVLANPVSVATTTAGASQNITFVPDAIGTYQFQVIATDDKGLSSAPAFVTFTTTTCGAGVPVMTASGTNVGTGARLSGSSAATPFAASLTNLTPTVGLDLQATATDSDNACLVVPQILNFTWSILNRPPLSKSVISDPSSGTPTFKPDVSGDYQLQVFATDPTGLTSAPSLIHLTVSSCGEVGPIVSALVSTPASAPLKVGGTTTLSAPTITPNNCVITSQNPSGPYSYSYAWKIENRPSGSQAALSLPSAAAPSFLADKAGDYLLSLTVTNTLGLPSDTQFITVTAGNCGELPLTWQATPLSKSFSDPQATPATPAADLQVGSQVTLTANLNADPNAASCGSSIPVTPYTYRWALISGPTGSQAALTATDVQNPGFVPDIQGDYQVSASVTDALGNSSPTQVLKISTTKCGANVPSVQLFADSAFTVPAPSSITANTPTQYFALVTNADNTTGFGTTQCSPRFQVPSHTLAWSVSQQPTNGQSQLSSSTGSNVTFAASVSGIYAISATATAVKSGITGLPTAQQVTVGACGSAAPSISKVSSTILVSSVDTPTSRPPLNTAVKLTPATTGASCGLENAASFTWTAVSVPSGSAVSLPAPNVASPGVATVTLDVAGTYTFSVTAKSQAGLVSAPLSVTLQTAACSPTVSASSSNGSFVTGAAVNLTSAPTSTCAVNATATSSWTLTSKPPASAAVIASPSSSVTSFTPDLAGHYEATVIATDNAGFTSAPSTLAIDVSSCGTNKPTFTVATTANPITGSRVDLTPTVDDSANQTACGAGFSLSPFAWNWALAASPQGSTAALVGATSKVPSIVADRPGSYTVSGTVTDRLGNTSAAVFTTFSVSACGSSTPVITQITAPTSRPGVNTSVTLTATSFDADTQPGASGGVCGTTGQTADTQYQWTVVSAPAGTSITLPSGFQNGTGALLATSTFTFTDTFAGTYTFQVVARDAAGHVSAPSTISVATSTCGPTIADITIPGTVPAGTKLLPTPNASPTVGTQVTFKPASDPSNPGIGAVTDTCIASPSVVKTFSLAGRPNGSSATIDASTGAFTPDAPGAYQIQYLAQDQAGNATTATTVVTAGACGIAPTVSAINFTLVNPNPQGGDPALVGQDVGTRVDLSAIAAPTSGCGTLATLAHYSWSLVSKPAGSTAELSDTASPTPSFSFDKPNGHYEVALTVIDNYGNSSTLSGSPASIKAFDTTSCGYQRPSSAITGSSTVNTNASTALTAGTPAYASGDLADSACPVRLRNTVANFTYAWSFLSGPVGGNLTFSSTTGSPITVSPNKTSAGTPYQIGLRVTSDRGTTGALSTFSLTANACGGQAPFPQLAGPIPAFSATQTINGQTYGPHTLATDAISLNAGYPVVVTANVVDPDNAAGCALGQAVFVHWALTAVPPGSLATLSGADTATTSFTPDLSGPYTTTIVSTDSTGLSSTNSFTTTIDTSANACGTHTPTVSSITADTVPGSAPLPFFIGTPLVLTSNAADADIAAPCSLPETLSYAWSVASAPPGSLVQLGAPNAKNPTFTPDKTGGYTFTLRVTDSAGHSRSFTSGTITVANGSAALTIASLAASQVTPAGTLTASDYDQSYPIVLTTDASDSDYADTCSGALPCSYSWSLVSLPPGSHAALNSTVASNPSFTPDVAGLYTARVTISEHGKSSTQTFAALNVGACGGNSPVAVIDEVQPISTPAPAEIDVAASGITIQLTAINSSDADQVTCGLPQTLSYRWTLLTSPVGSQTQLNDSSLVNPSITPDRTGTYMLQVQVSDGTHTASKQMKVVVGTGTISSIGVSGPLHASATDPTNGNPVLAVYNPDVGNGTITALRCTNNCNGPQAASWAQIGSVIDTNVGVLTWNDLEDPRPIAITVDEVGQVAVAYHTLNPSTRTSSPSPCSVVLATFTGGAWSYTDIGTQAQGTTVGSGCTADGTGFPDYGRWLSLSAETQANGGRLVVGLTHMQFFYPYTSGDVQACQSGCGVGQPAAGMTFPSEHLISAGPSERFNSVSAYDGVGALLAYNYADGLIFFDLDSNYAEVGSSGYSINASYLQLANVGGTTAIAWYDMDTHTPWFAHCSGPHCGGSLAMVSADTGGDLGRFLSLGFSGGTAQLAYYDATNNVMKLATTVSISTPLFTYTPFAVGGTSSSLSVNPANGNARVVYSTASGSSPALKLFAQ